MNARELRSAIDGEAWRLARLKCLLELTARTSGDAIVDGQAVDLRCVFENLVEQLEASAARLFDLAEEPRKPAPEQRRRKGRPTLAVVPSSAA